MIHNLNQTPSRPWPQRTPIVVPRRRKVYRMKQRAVPLRHGSLSFYLHSARCNILTLCTTLLLIKFNRATADDKVKVLETTVNNGKPIKYNRVNVTITFSNKEINLWDVIDHSGLIDTGKLYLQWKTNGGTAKKTFTPTNPDDLKWSKFHVAVCMKLAAIDCKRANEDAMVLWICNKFYTNYTASKEMATCSALTKKAVRGNIEAQVLMGQLSVRGYVSTDDRCKRDTHRTNPDTLLEQNDEKWGYTTSWKRALALVKTLTPTQIQEKAKEYDDIARERRAEEERARARTEEQAKRLKSQVAAASGA